MDIIETTAPISVDELKKYFENQDSFYLIDYNNSQLKEKKILTYVGNLDIPCDLDLSKTPQEDIVTLFKEYLQLEMICNVPVLERMMIEVIHYYKGLSENNSWKVFVEGNEELIDKWISKLDSLTLYNMYIVNNDEFKSFVETLPLDESDSEEGINFVSLLKHANFYSSYHKINQDGLKFYKNYFNKYMFKGNNLYSYWANENNPLFLLTFGISEGIVKGEEYVSLKTKTVQELKDASLI